MLGNLVSDSRYSVIRCVEALTNWRALVLIGAAALMMVVLCAVGARLGIFIFWLTGLLGVVVMAAGFSAAGTCLLDQARGNALRSLPDYFAAGLLSLPRLLALGLLIVLAYLALFIVAAILLFICKLPGLGPLLLAVLIPVLVSVFALAAAAVFIMLALAAPAIWDGCSVLTAFSAALKIARSHPWEVLTRLFLGYILCWLVSAFFVAFVMLAAFQVAGLSGSIIGVGGIRFDVMGGAGFGAGNHVSLMLAAGFGYGLVFSVVAALLSMMPVMLSVLVWLEFSAQIDLQAVTAKAEEAVQAMKQNVAQAQQKYSTPVPTPAAAAQEVSDNPAVAEQELAVETVLKCPECGAVVHAGDSFCGTCGQQMA